MPVFMWCSMSVLPVGFFPGVKTERQFLSGLLLAALLAGTVLPRLQPATRAGPDTGTNGFRRVLADWLWLEANLAWERHEPEKVRELIGFTVLADPQSPYFWRNSARMLAYDLPAWRCADSPSAPETVQRHWRREAAEEALRLLVRGQEWHRATAELWVEMGGIALYGLGEPRLAAGYFSQAAACPDAPEYAARLAARLAGGSGVAE
jgi:hypothetical protein